MNTSRGFTVVEMLVAVGSSLAILAAVGGFARGQARMVGRECRRLSITETSRRVLDTIAREIRGAGFTPVTGGFDGAVDGLSLAEPNRIELRADLHGATSADPPDGVVDVDSDERVGFVLNSARGSVSQSIGRQSLPLTLDGSVPPDGLHFRYFDACDEELVPPSGLSLAAAELTRVRHITVALTVREGSGNALAADATATLRNRQALRCE